MNCLSRVVVDLQCHHPATSSSSSLWPVDSLPVLYSQIFGHFFLKGLLLLKFCHSFIWTSVYLIWDLFYIDLVLVIFICQNARWAQIHEDQCVYFPSLTFLNGMKNLFAKFNWHLSKNMRIIPVVAPFVFLLYWCLCTRCECCVRDLNCPWYLLMNILFSRQFQCWILTYNR